MRITYDPRYDLLYLKLGEADKVYSKDVSEDITLDMDVQGRLVGIEILSASEHIDIKSLLPIEIKKEALR